MPKEKDQKSNDVNPSSEKGNSDWFEKYETDLENREKRWLDQENSWQKEQSRWNFDNQREWKAQQFKNKIIEEQVTGNLLRILKITGGLTLGVFILVGVVNAIQSNSFDSSSDEREIVHQPDQSSTPINIVPQPNYHSSNSIHPSSPKAQCGDSSPSLSDYPLLMYPVLVDYSSQTLDIITSHYCADAKRREDSIMVASFQSIDNARAFAEKMSDAVGNAKIGQPVWIESSGKVAKFPLQACGDPPLPSGQLNSKYYRVYVEDNQKELLTRIRSEFCQDAQEVAEGNGNNLIKVATFYTKAPALKFKEFITYRLGVNGILPEQVKPSNVIDVSHESLLQQCSKLALNHSLNGKYTMKWVWNDKSYEGVVSINGEKGSMAIEFPDATGWNPSIEQTITLRTCDFGGIALLGSNPVDINTQRSSTYLPDHFFVKVLPNSSQEITVCSEGVCVSGQSFTSD